MNIYTKLFLSLMIGNCSYFTYIKTAEYGLSLSGFLYILSIILFIFALSIYKFSEKLTIKKSEKALSNLKNNCFYLLFASLFLLSMGNIVSVINFMS